MIPPTGVDEAIELAGLTEVESATAAGDQLCRRALRERGTSVPPTQDGSLF